MKSIARLYNIKWVLAIITFTLALSVSMFSVDMVSNPSICIGCHEVEHDNSSLYDLHFASKIGCIDCHSGKGVRAYVETRTELFDAVLLKSLSPVIDQNVSAGFRHIAAQANCIKCHLRVTSVYFNHSANTNCTRCHNISGLQESSEEGFWKKMGTGGHSNKTCEDCHTTGFLIPSCMQCHTPHMKGEVWNNSKCLACHNNPHIPVRNGVFEEGIPKANCGACHKGEYETLEFYNSRHNQLGSCVNCHPAHSLKVNCFSCHLGDHSSHPFSGNNCAGCHGKASCMDCHKEPHSPLMGVPRIASQEQFNDYASTRKS